MENSPLVIFDEIWPETMYYNSTWSFVKILSNFKNSLKIQFRLESAQIFT